MKKTVEVITLVDIEIDETEFTPEFMAEFKQHIHPFETLNDHIAHLARLENKGMLYGFVEGYGQINKFVKSAEVFDESTDVWDAPE